jgi:hypothetical protein
MFEMKNYDQVWPTPGRPKVALSRRRRRVTLGDLGQL